MKRAAADHDARNLKLPAATLTEQEADEVVGVCIHFFGKVAHLVANLFEAELAAEAQAREWGTAGFKKAKELLEIHRKLESQLAPVRNLLPLERRRIVWEVDPPLVRVCYYVWLKLWREEPDDLLYGAAILWGNWKGSALGLAQRIGRNQEIFVLQQEDQKTAVRLLEDQGLGVPASVAMRQAPGTAEISYRGLLRSVAGVARRKGLPAALGNPADNQGEAALALAKSLPTALTDLLDTETRRVVRAAGFDYFDCKRSERGRTAHEVLLSHVNPSDEAQLGGSGSAREKEEDRSMQEKREARDFLAAAEAALGPESRAVLNLKREGFRDAEIAKTLGLDKSTVHYHVKKILEALKVLGARPLTRPRS